MHYHWLVFDADNTLLDFTRSAKVALSETLHSIGLAPSEQLFDQYHLINQECWADLEAGRITPEELKVRRFSRFLGQLGMEGDPLKLNAFYFEVLKQSTYLVDGAEATIANLHGQGYKLAIATNGLAEVQRPRLANAGIDHYFQEILVSEEIGYYKPNPGFFHMALERMQAKKADRLLMIGDSMHLDIESAQKMGWDTCWYNPESKKKPLPVEPDFIIGNLRDLMEILP